MVVPPLYNKSGISLAFFGHGGRVLLLFGALFRFFLLANSTFFFHFVA